MKNKLAYTVILFSLAGFINSWLVVFGLSIINYTAIAYSFPAGYAVVMAISEIKGLISYGTNQDI